MRHSSSSNSTDEIWPPNGLTLLEAAERLLPAEHDAYRGARSRLDAEWQDEIATSSDWIARNGSGQREVAVTWLPARHADLHNEARRENNMKLENEVRRCRAVLSHRLGELLHSGKIVAVGTTLSPDGRRTPIPPECFAGNILQIRFAANEIRTSRPPNGPTFLGVRCFDTEQAAAAYGRTGGSTPPLVAEKWNAKQAIADHLETHPYDGVSISQRQWVDLFLRSHPACHLKAASVQRYLREEIGSSRSTRFPQQRRK